MNRSLTKLGLFFLCALLFNTFAWAETTGVPAQYEVKIAKMLLYNSTTSSWVTVYDGLSSALDIASVSSGDQFVGNFVSGLTIPDGVYTKSKVTPGTTFTIKGTIAGYYTTSATSTIIDADPMINGMTVSVASNSGLSSAQSCNVTITTTAADSVGTTEQTFSTPITVQNGVADHKVRVYFNVDTGIAVNDAHTMIYPKTPTVTVSIE